MVNPFIRGVAVVVAGLRECEMKPPLGRGPVPIIRRGEDNLVYDGGFPSLKVAHRNEETRVRIPAAAPSGH
jgi:hypothetical protein